MTGKTLREQLPAGSARNKIEYLADAMDSTAAELFALLAGFGKPVKNYVRNPAFLDCSSNRAQQTNYEGNAVAGAIQGGPLQNTGTFADGWHFEQDGNKLDPTRSIAFSAHRNLEFPLFFTNVPFAANDIWVSVKNCKGSIYQNLYLPRKEAYYKARCFFAAKAGAVLNLGFRYVDSWGVGAIRSGNSHTITGDMYEAPPSTSYNVQTLESGVLKVSRSRNDPEMIALEIQSRPGQQDNVMLLGMQVFETDKDGKPLSDGLISMDSDGYGYTRFVESVEFQCIDTTVTGNQFQFSANGVSLDCPAGAENHITFNDLSFWQGVNGSASGNTSSGHLDDGITLVDFDGSRITLELSQANSDTVRNCGGMKFHARYTRTPCHRGLY